MYSYELIKVLYMYVFFIETLENEHEKENLIK